jgi:hypothetical protein
MDTRRPALKVVPEQKSTEANQVPSNPKVLIAGAGPVGLTLANELTRYGVPVRIVDKAAARTDKSKALVLWSRTLELLDDAGYAKEFLPAGMPAHGAQISTGSEIIARVTLDSIDSRYPYALMIPQNETERVLEEHLARLGVKVAQYSSPAQVLARASRLSAVRVSVPLPRRRAGDAVNLISAWWATKSSSVVMPSRSMRRRQPGQVAASASQRRSAQ